MDQAKTTALANFPGSSSLLACGGDMQKLRAMQYERAKMIGLGPIWKYSNEYIDDAIVKVGREGLVVAADRMDMFPVNMPNWLSILELTSHKVSDSRAAERAMIPGSIGEGGMQDKTPYTIPIYVTFDGFGFNARELAAAERASRPLDTDEIEQAVRNVNYAIEDAVISGGPTVGGNTSPGLSSTTNVQQFGDSGRVWDHASKTGANILADVLAMRLVLATDKFYGPYTLYVSTTYGATLQQFMSATQALTIQQALEGLEFGGTKLRVKVADLLTEDVVYLVQDTANVVDVIVGQQPVAMQPKPEMDWYENWCVYAVIVPRVKSDYSSNFGVCKGNTSGT